MTSSYHPPFDFALANTLCSVVIVAIVFCVSSFTVFWCVHLAVGGLFVGCWRTAARVVTLYSEFSLLLLRMALYRSSLQR